MQNLYRNMLYTPSRGFLHETTGCHGSEGLHSDLLAWDIVLYHGDASTFRAEDGGTRFFPNVGSHPQGCCSVSIQEYYNLNSSYY